MRTESFAFGAAGAIWHFLAFSALTLALWIATRGQRPARPLAAALAALVTGATLYFLQGKPACAESSPR